MSRPHRRGSGCASPRARSWQAEVRTRRVMGTRKLLVHVCSARPHADHGGEACTVLFREAGVKLFSGSTVVRGAPGAAPGELCPVVPTMVGALTLAGSW